MSLFDELKRRNVFRVGFAYLVLGWVLLQVVDVVLPILELPDWVARLVLLLLAIGFPVVLFFAWAFELTPEGIKRERDVDRSRSITPQTGRKLDRLVIGILAVAVVVLLLDRFRETRVVDVTESEDVSNPIVASAETSIAVLPFLNMSDDESNEYFSDGISEELLNVLVRIDGLRVPSRTSSFNFKDSDKSIAEIGRELKVDHILEGSVRKAGERIRVTAQLIDVQTDTHLWSDSYTRQVDDIFAVQDEIAKAIVTALQLTLSGAEQNSLSSHSTSDVAAYNKYLQGRFQWNQRSAESLLAAVEPLREAVDIDPQFDQAWSALADTYALIPEYKAGSIGEYIPLGREAAERALQIKPDSARALTALAYIKAMYEYDFPGATADFERAISLEPAYATAHQWYAEILAVQRQTEKALDQMELAAQADPLSAIVSHVIGWIHWGVGDLEEAIKYYQRAHEVAPDMPNPVGNMSRVYALLGRYDDARVMALENAQLLGKYPDVDLAVIDAMENPELKPRALEMLEKSDYGRGVFDAGYIYIVLDEHEKAIQSLEFAFEQGDPYAIHVNRMIVYDVLRDDPRFQAMLEKMNLLP